MKSTNEIVIYQANDFTKVEVKIGEDTVWLNRQQIADLFNRDVKTIGKHINNVFSEGELNKEVVVANFATTTQHGAIEGKTQTRNVEFYNLDVERLLGFPINKQFIPSVANTVGTNMRTYKIIKKNKFAYGPALHQWVNDVFP